MVGSGFKAYIYTLMDSHVDLYTDACHTDHTVSDHGNNGSPKTWFPLPGGHLTL